MRLMDIWLEGKYGRSEVWEDGTAVVTWHESGKTQSYFPNTDVCL